MLKTKGQSDVSQDQTNMLILDLLKQGKRVVRLKTGDPFMYGRGGEEILFFRQYGFEPIVVPGLSSVMAAPTLANIPLTHRGVADSVVVLSGRGQNGAFPDIPQYQPKRTTVFLMVMKRIGQIVQQMLDKGYPATLPCAILEKGGWKDSRTIYTCIHDLEQVVESQAIGQPALLVVGEAVTLLSIDIKEP